MDRGVNHCMIIKYADETVVIGNRKNKKQLSDCVFVCCKLIYQLIFCKLSGVECKENQGID